MARVVDYASLSQAVQDFYARSDLGTYIDYLIQSAEDRIYNDIFAMNAGQGIRALELTVAGTTDANGQFALSLLPNYLALKEFTVSLSGNTFWMLRRSPELIYTKFANRQASGTPAYIAREGANFIFGPYPDASYVTNAVYWATQAGLSSGNTTSWMTAVGFASILLECCCSTAARFLKDPELAAFWDGLYKEHMMAYLLRDKAEDLDGGGLATVAG